MSACRGGLQRQHPSAKENKFTDGSFPLYGGLQTQASFESSAIIPFTRDQAQA